MLFIKKDFGSVGRGQGLSFAAYSQYHPAPTDSHQDTLEPLHQKAEKALSRNWKREEWRRCEKNQATIRVRKEEGTVGSPAIRAEISLQFTEESRVEQAFSYSLWDGCCAGAREECEKKAVTERNAMKWPQSLISPPMLLLCRKDVEVLEIKKWWCPEEILGRKCWFDILSLFLITQINFNCYWIKFVFLHQVCFARDSNWLGNFPVFISVCVLLHYSFFPSC